MDTIKELAQLDYTYIIFSVLIILAGFKAIVSLVDWWRDKIGWETKWQRQKREEREQLKLTTELAKTTAENLDKLQKRHTKDEEEFRNNLNNYIEESRADRKVLHEEMSKLAERQESRDKQIEALMCGSKELLGDTIDQRYNKYISLSGIPQNEVDEFDDIYIAYKRLGGNHGRDAKYNYVKNNLDVIPVKTELVIDKK